MLQNAFKWFPVFPPMFELRRTLDTWILHYMFEEVWINFAKVGSFYVLIFNENSCLEIALRVFLCVPIDLC